MPTVAQNPFQTIMESRKAGKLSDKPWGDFSDSDYKDAADYCSACLIDNNPSGEEKTKDLCKLPVREPNGGPLNRNGMSAAQGALMGARGGLKEPRSVQVAAAKKLVGLMNSHDIEPSDDLKKLAGG